MPAPSLSRRVKGSEISRRPSLWIILVFALTVVGVSFFTCATLHSLYSSKSARAVTFAISNCLPRSSRSRCNFAEGNWVFDEARKPLYGEACPFHRNAWNCGKNKRPDLDDIYKWKWIPQSCDLLSAKPASFLSSFRNMNFGFVGDSLNENMLVSLLCILATADPGARIWKKRRAWRGAYFPRYNVTVAYHRAVLLADYHEWKATNPAGQLEKLGYQRGYQVNVDIPARDWINLMDFYDVIVFNTGHWWGLDKFPLENPLLFFEGRNPIIPPLSLREGLEVVLSRTLTFLERTFPSKVLKIWRTQSPRHFEGGDWNQNGTCLSNQLLQDNQIEQWFGLDRGGVNREAREINAVIEHVLEGSSFMLLNVTHLSEFRTDAHPAIWLGQKDAHIKWGQDCMHWCLPGLPDTWVDILLAMVLDHLNTKQSC